MSINQKRIFFSESLCNFMQFTEITLASICLSFLVNSNCHFPLKVADGFRRVYFACLCGFVVLSQIWIYFTFFDHNCLRKSFIKLSISSNILPFLVFAPLLKFNLIISHCKNRYKATKKKNNQLL